MKYLFAIDAHRAGHRVSGFTVTTYDGREIAVLLWGQRHADGTDTRGAELIGGPICARAPCHPDTAVWLIHSASVYDYRELPKAMRRKAQERARAEVERRRFERAHRRSQAIRAAAEVRS